MLLYWASIFDSPEAESKVLSPVRESPTLSMEPRIFFPSGIHEMNRGISAAGPATIDFSSDPSGFAIRRCHLPTSGSLARP